MATHYTYGVTHSLFSFGFSRRGLWRIFCRLGSHVLLRCRRFLRRELDCHSLSFQNRHLVYLRTIEELVNACGNGSGRSDEFSLDNAIDTLLIPETEDLGAGVRDTLINSGKIEILTDRQLRHELSEWDSELDELLDDQAHNAGIVFDIVIPYLARAGVSVSGSMSSESKYWALPRRFLSGDSETLTKLCSDPEFISIVEVRYGFMVHAAGEFDRVLSAIDRILARIESSLTE